MYVAAKGPENIYSADIQRGTRRAISSYSGPTRNIFWFFLLAKSVMGCIWGILELIAKELFGNCEYLDKKLLIQFLKVKICSDKLIIIFLLEVLKLIKLFTQRS